MNQQYNRQATSEQPRSMIVNSSSQSYQQHQQLGIPNNNSYGLSQAYQNLRNMLKQILRFQKWMQEMVMQIHKELEYVVFRFILQLFKEVNRQLRQFEGSQRSYYFEHLMSMASTFLQLEIKENIELLAKVLQNLQRGGVREPNYLKLKVISHRYYMIFVSQCTYQCALCFLNDEANELYYCKTIFLKYVKQRNAQNFDEYYGQNLALDQSDFWFIPGIDKDENEMETDFLTSYEEIKLFLKLEVVKKKKAAVSEIHLFNKARHVLDQNIKISDDKPMPQLVYSVMEKSQMVHDFLERKDLESDSSHPSVLKFRIDDANEQVTCVEISKSGDVILCGMQNSQIYLFDISMLNPNNLNYYDDNSEESIFIHENNDTMQGKISQTRPFHPNETSSMKFRIKFLGHEDSITSLSILYNDQYFVSASIDLSIRLWDIRLNVCLNIFKGHLNTIWNVRFANQGFIFGSCSADKTAMLWTTNRTTIQKALIGHNKDVTQILFTENLLYAITAGLDNSVKFWEIKSGLCALTLALEVASPVSSMHISFSGYYFVTGHENGDVRLWDIHEQTLVKCVHLESERNRKSIYSVDISFDESTICVNTSKSLCYYSLNQFETSQGENIYEDFYIGGEEFFKKQELNRFSSVEPKEIYELPTISTEKLLKSFIHMRNFIIVISKQS